MGRRRVEIKKIEDKARRQTTFTKRRDGLFKKTDQLCSMCDIEAAVITFSNAGNAFAFGNPSVDSVIDRYLAKTDAESRDPVNELQDKLANALARLEIEKKRGKAIDRALEKLNLQCKGKATAEEMAKLQIGNKSHCQAEEMARLEAKKKRGEAIDRALARLNLQRKVKATAKLQIGNESHCQAEEMARLEAEKKRGEVADKAFAILNPPIEASRLEELERKRKGKGKATVDEMTESELQSGNKSLRLAMRREEALALLEAEKNCREAIDEALAALNEPVEASRSEELERQRKEKAAVEEIEMTELRSDNQAEALARLEAEKKHDEAIDEVLAIFNAKLEASRMEKCEQQRDVTMEDIEMTEPELQSANKGQWKNYWVPMGHQLAHQPTNHQTHQSLAIPPQPTTIVWPHLSTNQNSRGTPAGGVLSE